MYLLYQDIPVFKEMTINPFLSDKTGTMLSLYFIEAKIPNEKIAFCFLELNLVV